MSYLVDTNIFLEILLEQDKKEICKSFLKSHIGEIFISDFSLHSIGVILFKYNKTELFNAFIEDTLDKLEVLTLSKEKYKEIIGVYNQYKLDFDDSYQFLISKENEMTIATQDNDYKIVDKITSIRFI
jgi:predicted nucleic acid-binding protein